MTSKVIAALTAIMAFIFCFGHPSFAQPPLKKRIQVQKKVVATPVSAPFPEQIDPAKETSIDRIVVGVFRSNVADPKLAALWNAKRVEYQNSFAAILNERSYLEAIVVGKEFSLGENKDVISNEAQRDGVDGAVVGEFRGKSIELAIRSGASGRTMARMSVPVLDLEGQNIREIANQAVDQVVQSFPYRGFVVARKDNEVKLNLGKAQGVKVGTVLEIDELEGEFPNFSSQMNRVGLVKITKLANNAAIGTVTQSSKPIKPYAKVSFAKADDKAMEEQLFTRYHDRLFLSIGAEFYYIDTQVSNPAAKLASGAINPLVKRIYQVPLSPALGVGFGYNRLAVFALVSGLSNSSNNVILLNGAATFELVRHPVKQLNFITSVGAYYASYQATPVAGGQYPLDSVSTYSGLVEERIQYVTSPQTKLFLSGRLYIPVFSNDVDNGNSVLSKSFGGGFEAGIRLDLSKKFSVESGIQSRDMFVGVPSGENINEFEYGFFAHLLFRM